MRPKCDKSEISSVIKRKSALILALALPLGLMACSQEKATQETVRPVKAFVVGAPSAERTLTYSGVLKARIESTLGFRVAGKIVERFVNVGDQVKIGDTIARLDEKDLKLAENSARAAVAAAKTRLDVADQALGRANYLYPKGFIAKAAVDQRQLETDSAKAALDAAQDQLAQAVNSTSYSVLLADKEGIVTSVSAEPGQVVGAGQPIITLAYSGELEALVAVPEQEIVKLKAGDPAVVGLWAAPNVKSAGVIREIAGSADAASRTYAVRVTIANPSPEMRLGMTVRVAFSIPEDASSVALPVTALTEQNGKSFVFVADRASEKVTKREVFVEGVSADAAKVSGGLKPGDIVVTAGVQFLRDGMKVRLRKDALTAVAQADVPMR